LRAEGWLISAILREISRLQRIVMEPRLARKKRARTWGTRRFCDIRAEACSGSTRTAGDSGFQAPARLARG